MKITLKNFRHFPSGSEETSCFTADIWIDGKKEGSAKNAGHGGPTDIWPPALEARLEAHAATLPDLEFKSGDKVYTIKSSADLIIDEIVEKLILTNTIKRHLSKRVFYTIKDKDGIYQTKAVKADVLKTWLAMPGLAEKLNADKILNRLPIEEAVEIWYNVFRGR